MLSQASEKKETENGGIFEHFVIKQILFVF